VLYVTAFIDRVNVGFAGLDMTRELHFSNEVFGFGAGIFFFGYCLLEIPGAVLAARWSARKWIAIVMVTWGVLAACTGFVNSGMQFHVIRFLVGFAEGGFFPAVVVYLTFWFRQQDRAKAVATFMAAIPVAQAVGAPIAGYLLRLDWLGVSAWRWLLILEGIPAFLLGIVTLFYLPDRPADVRWLSSAEKDWITAELASELRGKLSSQGHFTILRAFTRPVVLALAVSYFFVNTAGYAISIWLPKIIQDFRGFSTLEISLVAAIPPALAIPTMLIVGWHSDRTGERRWHAAGAALAAAVGLAVSQIPGSHAIAMAGFTIAVMGVMSY
jgi:ACS family tartrate transporter-like MFS transporter